MLCIDGSLVSRVRAIRMHGLNGSLDRLCHFPVV